MRLSLAGHGLDMPRLAEMESSKRSRTERDKDCIKHKKVNSPIDIHTYRYGERQLLVFVA